MSNGKTNEVVNADEEPASLSLIQMAIIAYFSISVIYFIYLLIFRWGGENYQLGTFVGMSLFWPGVIFPALKSLLVLLVIAAIAFYFFL